MGVLLWLVCWARCAGTRDVWPALAALVGPVQNNFFHTGHYFSSFILWAILKGMLTNAQIVNPCPAAVREYEAGFRLGHGASMLSSWHQHYKHHLYCTLLSKSEMIFNIFARFDVAKSAKLPPILTAWSFIRWMFFSYPFNQRVLTDV